MGLRAVGVGAAALGALLVIAIPSNGAAQGTSPAAGVRISAHRGGAGQWPQDSLRAFANSLVADYDDMEGDAWLTADGVPVIYHDTTIDGVRCGGAYPGRPIWTLAAAEVATIRCDGQPIPTERQLLALIAGSPNTRTVLRLETKNPPGHTPDEAAAAARVVGGLVVRAGLAPRAVMQDFDWNGIRGYHSVSRALRVSALTGRLSAAAIRRAEFLGAYDISFPAGQATPALSAYAVAHHLMPVAYGSDPTPHRPTPLTPAQEAAAIDDFHRLACAGVQVVISNYPRLLVRDRAVARFTCRPPS